MYLKWILLLIALLFPFCCYGCDGEQEAAPAYAFTEPAEIGDMESESQPFVLTTTETLSTEEPQPIAPVKHWYKTGRLIYHACGSVENTAYTNSREAMEATLSRGNLLVEVDFLFTRDRQLICGHSWKDLYENEQPRTLEEFLRDPVMGRFTPLTASDVIAYMDQYPGLYIVVDTKERDLPAVVKELIRLCDGRPEIADQFIIQIYGKHQKEKVLDCYPFPEENILLSCYKFGPERYYEILNICRDEDIGIVTFQQGSWTPEVLARFLKKDIILLEHTVNDPQAARQSMDLGVYGFYTDFLEPNQILSENEP